MKKIETLVPDIYKTLEDGTEIPKEDIGKFGQIVAEMVAERIQPHSREFQLRMSNLGQCPRKLWYEKHRPEGLEPLEGYTRLKFLIGDLWEAVLLFLAKAAGHEVVGQQDEVDLYGVKGHRDAVIDGMVVDAKSASPYSFGKFKNGLDPSNDSFGYLTQIGGYLEAGQSDDLVSDKERSAFLAADKTLGHIHLDIHGKSDLNYQELIEDVQKKLDSPVPPERPYSDVPFQKSGNRRLDTVCSYCHAKYMCWPNLRRVDYASGPVWLTKVQREPRVKSDDPF